MSGTALKLIALLAMLLDHVAEFIPGTPYWFHYIGRIAAPIFMFCLVQGFEHTSDKIKYLKRLYFGSVVMGILNAATSMILPENGIALENNFFATLFLLGLIITIIEKKKNNDKDTNQLIIFAVIAQVVSIVLCFVVEALARAIEAEGAVGAAFGLFVRENASHLVNGFIPNVIFTEGGYLLLVFGFMMYYYKNKKKAMPIIFAYMCVVYAIIVLMSYGAKGLLSEVNGGYQWMMILATPFFYLYNGERGKGLKYLFYIFYPLHLIALFFIGNYLV